MKCGSPLRVERRRAGVSIAPPQLPNRKIPFLAFPLLTAFTANFMSLRLSISDGMLNSQKGKTRSRRPTEESPTLDFRPKLAGQTYGGGYTLLLLNNRQWIDLVVV